MGEKKIRVIAVAVTHRAPYGRLKPVLWAIQKHPELELKIIVATPTVVHSLWHALRHGRFSSLRETLPSYIRTYIAALVGGKRARSKLDTTSQLIEADGFKIEAHVPTFVAGGNLEAMTKSVGTSLLALPDVLQDIKPDILLVHADRFEMLPFAVAGAMLNIPVAHTQGGDVSGTIDETVRHAITKLADLHFPTTEKSRDRIVQMGEHPDYVFMTGCPTIDAIKAIDYDDFDIYARNHPGWGDALDFSKPFVLVMHHPVTTEYDRAEEDLQHLLSAIREINMPTLLFSPNIDAGTDKATKLLRTFIKDHTLPALNVQKNVNADDFYRLLRRAAVAIGNSSSFIREGSWLGTPAVLVGSRQSGRERADNVIEVLAERHAIVDAIRQQIAHGTYASSDMYGDGTAAQKITDILVRIELPPRQKSFRGT